jgi:hypothetical protein
MAGAGYEVQASGRGVFQGPTVTFGLRVTAGAHPATLGLQGQARLPAVLQEGTLYGYALRLLGTAAVNRWAQVGVGGAVEYNGAAGGDGPLVTPDGVFRNPNGNYGWRSLTTVSGRLLARGGPVTVAGLPVSATASLDLEQSLNNLWTWYQSTPWRVRPAVALEIWWR